MVDTKEWLEYENSLLNQQVTKIRLKKLKNMYSVTKRFITKPLNKCTRKDIEEFVYSLHRNKYQQKNGRPYSGSTKSDLKKFLKQYFKWKKGNGETYPPEVSWIKTNIAKDEQPEEKPILSLKEVGKLAYSFENIEYRVLTLLLFDSGFRIQEMLSAKKKDLTWDSYEDEEKCFWINCNESKTFKRKVPVPLFQEDVKGFFNSTYYKTLENDDPLFKCNYNAYRKALNIAGMRVIGKKISPHCLRHSSATYYSKEFDGNMHLIAQRYGWSFSSEELKTYIRKSGAYQKQGVKKVFDNELLKIKKENELLRQRLDKLERFQTILTISQMKQLKKMLK